MNGAKLPPKLPPKLPSDLLVHLENTLGLSRAGAIRVTEEVCAYYGELVEEFVVRRHRELQAEGINNAAAFVCIERELTEARFRAPALTVRQIRSFILTMVRLPSSMRRASIPRHSIINRPSNHPLRSPGVRRLMIAVNTSILCVRKSSISQTQLRGP